MCVVSDMEMYYRRSFVGYRDTDGLIKPFYVLNVVVKRHLVDEDDYDYDSLSDLLLSDYDELNRCLEFKGILYENSDVNREIRVGFDDPNLVREMPDAGYIRSNRKWYWVSYRCLHSAKKGLTRDRLAPSFFSEDSMSRIIDTLYNWQPTEFNPHRDILFVGGVLNYRGIIIGNEEDGVINVKQKADYLGQTLTTLFPSKVFNFEG